MGRRPRYDPVDLALWVAGGITNTPVRVSRADLADHVFKTVAIHLTVADVSRGLAGIRDMLKGLPPPALGLASDRSGICWTLDVDEIRKEHRRRIRTARTVVRRGVLGAVLPYLRAKHPASVTTLEHLLELVDRELAFLESRV